MMVGKHLTHKVFNLDAVLFEFLHLLFTSFYVISDDNEFTYLSTFLFSWLLCFGSWGSRINKLIVSVTDSFGGSPLTRCPPNLSPLV